MVAHAFNASTLGQRQRWADFCEFEATVVHIMSFRAARAAEGDPVLSGGQNHVIWAQVYTFLGKFSPDSLINNSGNFCFLLNRNNDIKVTITIAEWTEHGDLCVLHGLTYTLRP